MPVLVANLDTYSYGYTHIQTLTRNIHTLPHTFGSGYKTAHDNSELWSLHNALIGKRFTTVLDKLHLHVHVYV